MRSSCGSSGVVFGVAYKVLRGPGAGRGRVAQQAFEHAWRHAATYDARFRDAVEEDFRIHHDVAHYARRLGYSARTLSRSTQAATGRSAKQLIGERVLLEAKDYWCTIV